MKEHSRFYSSLGLLLLLNVVVKPLWIFGIDRQVQNAVGTETYGTYFSLYNFSIVFSFLLDRGLSSYFSRQLAAGHPEATGRIGHFFFIKVSFLFLYAAIVALVALFSGLGHWDILAGVIGVQALMSFFVFLRGVVTAHQWFRTDAWLSVLDKTLMIFLCGAYLLLPAIFGGMTIQKFLVVQVSCTLISIIAALYILTRNGVSLNIRGSSINLPAIIRDALPFAVTLLLMSVHNRLDGFMLERIHPSGAYEAGLYAAAYRLLDASVVFGYLLASFLLPFIARQWKEKGEINGVILTSRHLLLCLAVTASVTVITLAPWLQSILYHHQTVSGYRIMQWCLPALICYSLVSIYGTVLTATGHIRAFAWINALAVVVNTGLNLWWIPAYGGLGCSWAALISQGLCGLLVMIYARQKLKVGFHLRSILMYIFIGGILFAYFRAGQWAGIGNWFLLIGGGILSMLTIWASGLFPIHKWKMMLSQADHDQ